MNTVIAIVLMSFTPRKQCSEFDPECAFVTDHASCWCGIDALGERKLPQADGYCPYLVGEVKR